MEMTAEMQIKYVSPGGFSLPGPSTLVRPRRSTRKQEGRGPLQKTSQKSFLQQDELLFSCDFEGKCKLFDRPVVIVGEVYRIMYLGHLISCFRGLYHPQESQEHILVDYFVGVC